MRLTFLRSIAIAAVACVIGGSSAIAQPITGGNLIIYRVGDGAAALTTAATAVFLDEYTPTGTFVRSIALPATGASALSAVGNAATEGIISRSQDGASLIFTGYRKDVGGTNPSADAPATVNRVIGSIDLAGVASTTVALTDPTATIRSATTVAVGSPVYISTSTSIRYVGTPGPAATTVQIDARNSRQVNLSGNTLFASNGSTTIAAKVQSYGTLPTGATSPTAIATQALTDAVNGFFLCDLNPAIPGNDTLYFQNTVQNLLGKFTFDGVNWNSNGTIAAASTQNLTGVVSGSNVNLFLTSTTGLFAYTDSSGIGGSLTGTLGTAIATAGPNMGFRGIGTLSPVPEPSSLILGGLAVCGAVGFRKRRTR